MLFQPTDLVVYPADDFFQRFSQTHQSLASLLRVFSSARRVRNMNAAGAQAPAVFVYRGKRRSLALATGQAFRDSSSNETGNRLLFAIYISLGVESFS